MKQQREETRPSESNVSQRAFSFLLANSAVLEQTKER